MLILTLVELQIRQDEVASHAIINMGTTTLQRLFLQFVAAHLIVSGLLAKTNRRCEV